MGVLIVEAGPVAGGFLRHGAPPPFVPSIRAIHP